MIKNALKMTLAAVFLNAASPQQAGAYMGFSISMLCTHGAHDHSVSYSVSHNLDADRTVSFSFNNEDFDIFMRPIIQLGTTEFDDVNMEFTNAVINTGGVEIPVRIYFSNITDYISIRIREEDYNATFKQNEEIGVSPNGWLCEKRNNNMWRGI